MSWILKNRARLTLLVSLVSIMIIAVARPHVGAALRGRLASTSGAVIEPPAVPHRFLEVELAGAAKSVPAAFGRRPAVSLGRPSVPRTVLAKAVQPPAPGPLRAAAPVVRAASGRADWFAIARCESGGRWSLNNGNGFWGGLQFWPHTWFAYGGGPFNGVGPFPYSSAAQIAVAERVLAGQGPRAWPNCFRWK